MKSINVQAAHQQQTDGTPYLDVRSVAEFDRGHPAGAYNIPLLDAHPQTGQMTPNPDFVDVVRATFPPETGLLIGCQAGGRSMQACHVLESAGYRDVTNVAGGFGGSRMGDPGWAPSGLPTGATAHEGRSYDALKAAAEKSR